MTSQAVDIFSMLNKAQTEYNQQQHQNSVQAFFSGMQANSNGMHNNNNVHNRSMPVPINSLNSLEQIERQIRASPTSHRKSFFCRLVQFIANWIEFFRRHSQQQRRQWSEHSPADHGPLSTGSILPLKQFQQHSATTSATTSAAGGVAKAKADARSEGLSSSRIQHQSSAAEESPSQGNQIDHADHVRSTGQRREEAVNSYCWAFDKESIVAGVELSHPKRRGILFEGSRGLHQVLQDSRLVSRNSIPFACRSIFHSMSTINLKLKNLLATPR